VIGSVVNFSGNTAFGGFAAAGLSGGRSPYAAVADSSLFSGAALQSLGNSRSSVDQIKAALASLRDALTAARDKADAVPGTTTLQAVTADITQYVDKPTFVTVNGKPVQNGTVTVAEGTKQLVVGYARVNRAAPDVGPALKMLLNATVNVGSAPGLANVNTFGSQIATFLKNTDVTTAVTRPDKASLDSAIAQIDGMLAGAAGLSFSVKQQAAAAAQVNLGSLLLGASSSTSAGSTSPTTSANGAGAYQATASSTTSTSSGSTVKTVA